MSEIKRICPPIFRGPEDLINCDYCGQSNVGHSPDCPTQEVSAIKKELLLREFSDGFEDGIEGQIFEQMNLTGAYLLGYSRGLAERQRLCGSDSLHNVSCEEAKGLF